MDSRSVTYQRADGVAHTRKIDRAVDTDEVIVAVLRDKQQAVRFGGRGQVRRGGCLLQTGIDLPPLNLCVSLT